MKPRPYSKELEALRKNLELRLKNGIEFKWAGGFEPEFLVEGVMARVEALIKQSQIELLGRLLEQVEDAYIAGDRHTTPVIKKWDLEAEIKRLKEGE